DLMVADPMFDMMHLMTMPSDNPHDLTTASTITDMTTADSLALDMTVTDRMIADVTNTDMIATEMIAMDVMIADMTTADRMIADMLATAGPMDLIDLSRPATSTSQLSPLDPTVFPDSLISRTVAWDVSDMRLELLPSRFGPIGLEETPAIVGRVLHR